MKPAFYRAVLLGALLLLFTGCLPALPNLTQAPQFRLIPEGSGLQSINPGGVGTGDAVFLFYLEAYNPSPLPMTLQGLDFDFYLNRRYIADGNTLAGMSIPAGSSVQVPLEIRVPLENNLTLLTDFVGLVMGQRTSYRIDGTVILDLFGFQQALPKATLVEGELQGSFPLQPPSFRYLPEASGFQVGFGGVAVQLAMEVSNPSPMGYILRAPDLSLRIGQTRIAVAQLVEVPVPAFERAVVPIRLEVNALQLASDIATLGISGGVNIELAGGFGLEVPGITQGSFPVQVLLAGLLRAGGLP